jgi:hypothetical protein
MVETRYKFLLFYELMNGNAYIGSTCFLTVSVQKTEEAGLIIT